MGSLYLLVEDVAMTTFDVLTLAVILLVAVALLFIVTNEGI